MADNNNTSSDTNNDNSNNSRPPLTRQLTTNEEIEARLAKLRDETKSVVHQRELEERLARLANRDPNYYSSSEPPVKIYQMISKERAMTDDQKADHLMAGMFEEMRLGEERRKSGQEVDDEIARRLAQLREGLQLQSSTNQQQQNSNYNNLDNARPKTARELIEQILSEPDDVLPELKSGNRRGHSKMNISDDEEEEKSQGSDDDDEALDWCNTCNEDAVVRCLDCDDDIYCRECFRELHLDSDMRRHRTEPYQKKPRSKSSSSNNNNKSSSSSSSSSSRSNKKRN